MLFLLTWSSVSLIQSDTVKEPPPEIALKSLKELVLIRKTLARQAQRLRGLEINLHHVLSKVVFLSDEDIHAPRRFSTKGDPLLELTERLNQLLQRLDQRMENQIDSVKSNECKEKRPEGSPNGTQVNEPPKVGKS